MRAEKVSLGEFVTPGDNLLSVAVDNRLDFSTLPVGNESDREGIVVIGETPAVGLNFPDTKEDWYKDLSRTREHHEEVIRDMIDRDKNHPCIVMWSQMSRILQREPKALMNILSRCMTWLTALTPRTGR